MGPPRDAFHVCSGHLGCAAQDGSERWAPVGKPGGGGGWSASPPAEPAAGRRTWVSDPYESSLVLLSSALDRAAELGSPLLRGCSTHVEPGNSDIQQPLT